MYESYYDMFLQGGVVMIALFILSIISLAVIIERLVFIYRHNSQLDTIISDLKSTLKNNTDHKQKLFSKDSNSVSKHLEKLRLEISNPSPPKEVIEDIVSDVDASLKKRTHVLIFIVQLAPLLGILGTVLGLAEAFLSIGNLGGTEKFQFLSAGIGKALSTTIAGLIIAAYTMCGHYLIRYRTSKSLTSLTEKLSDYVKTSAVKDEN